MDTNVEMLWPCTQTHVSQKKKKKGLRTADSVDKALNQSQVRYGAGAIIYWFYGPERIT